MLLPAQSTTDRAKTVLIPVPIGKSLPDLPDAGITLIDDALRLAGAQVIDQQGARPGPNASTYVFVKRSVQRNLFRIQVR